MTDQWNFYLCTVNDKLASIFLNLALATEAPVLSKPYLLWVWVHLKSPRADGLTTGQEAQVMYKIEKELLTRLASSSEAHLAGSITTQSRREFYFYGATETDFKQNAIAAFRDFPTYEFSIGTKRDELWSQYFEVLYPSVHDLERIKNNDLLYVLAERGDVHAVPRRVLHWINFAGEETRNLFQVAVIEAGFEVEAIHTLRESEAEEPFVIVVAKFQSIEKSQIDETSIQLLELATKFQGEYTGWETPIMTQ